MSEAKKRTNENPGGQGSASRPSKKRFWFRHRPVSRITDAKKSPVEDWHYRRRLYLGLQVLRIPFLAAAVLVLWLNGSMAITAILAAISVPLPWVAVMLANEKGEATKDTEKVYKPGLIRAQRAAAAGSQIDPATSAHRQLGSGQFDSSRSPAHPVINHDGSQNDAATPKNESE